MAWTGYEFATLAVTALTPITVAGLSFFVARTGRRIERVQWANQTVITRRLEIFGEVAPKLNQLLCFATFVGGWKQIKPQDAIGLKRQIDETMYANRVLFSDQLFTAYQKFMTALFAMYATTDADAHLRAPVASKWGDRRNMQWWDESMASLFSTGQAGDINEIQAAYVNLGDQFRDDLYVTHQRTLLGAQPSDGGT
jgi:hypothetical protein